MNADARCKLTRLCDRFETVCELLAAEFDDTARRPKPTISEAVIRLKREVESIRDLVANSET